jgi:hypothetical protein
VESVSTVVKTSNLFIKILFILEEDCGVAEYSALVFGVGDAHVVVEVSNQLLLVHVVLLVEFGALLLQSQKHRLVVSCRID